MRRLLNRNVLFFTFLFLLFTIISYENISVASKNYSGQEAVILEFYKIINKNNPTLSDFIDLFGENNEAELVLILDIIGDSDVSYSRLAYSHPEEYPSLFLKCIKKEEPKLFSTKRKPVIVHMPKKNKDFNNYKVKINGQIIIFEFSRNDLEIENIYLPNGESIYELTKRKCGKKEIEMKK
jgi:hypothetical protein